MTQRHSWGERNAVSEHKTERVCTKCGMVRVTRHENDEHWTEFWKGLDRLPDDRTPACEGAT